MPDIPTPAPAAVPSQIAPPSTAGKILPEEPHLSRSLTAPTTVQMSSKRLQRSFGPLFKAYAFALRAKVMGGAGDLSSDNQAFFTSTSMQGGIPMKMHDAYVNARVFALADAIQIERNPILSEGGQSFVQYLER